jgi:hypothetical protein
MSEIAGDDLSDLVLDIDTNIFKWLESHNVNALELTAVILARLVWCARQGGYEDEFVKLLEAPKTIITAEKRNKETLH